jgi:basic membrane protein A
MNQQRVRDWMVRILAVSLVLVITITACGPSAVETTTPGEVAAAPTAPSQQPAPPTETPPPEAGAGETVEKVAVLLPASQTDHGWNQQAADSMAQVAEQRGFSLEVAENLGYGDISPVLRDLADRGFDLAICHASGYQTVCPEIASETGMKVVTIENPDAVTPGLVSDIWTEAEEVAYLAGVLAGKMTQSGTVGIVASGQPPTWNYMTVGFAEGLYSVKPDANLLYSVIGVAAYEDAAGAKRVTESQLAAGADIVFGMGDGASFGMIQAIAEHNAAQENRAWFIDVIGDKRDIPEADALLTSVLFDYSGIYDQFITDIENGTFGTAVTLDLASGGVRLLELPEGVPEEAVQAVDAARAAILAGTVTVSSIGDAEAMQQRLDELSP